MRCARDRGTAYCAGMFPSQTLTAAHSPQCAVSVLLEPSRACPIFRFPDIIAAATGLRNETQSSHSLVLLLAPVSSLEASLSVLAILILDGVEGSALRTVEL